MKRTCMIAPNGRSCYHERQRRYRSTPSRSSVPSKCPLDLSASFVPKTTTDAAIHRQAVTFGNRGCRTILWHLYVFTMQRLCLGYKLRQVWFSRYGVLRGTPAERDAPITKVALSLCGMQTSTFSAIFFSLLFVCVWDRITLTSLVLAPGN